MHATGGVDLGLELTGDVGELGSLEDVEVVVGGVAAAVAFSSNSGTWEKSNVVRRGNGYSSLCRGRKTHRR